MTAHTATTIPVGDSEILIGNLVSLGSVHSRFVQPSPRGPLISMFFDAPVASTQ